MSYRAKLLIVNEDRHALAIHRGHEFGLPEIVVETGRAGIAVYRAAREQLGLETFSLVLPPSGASDLLVLREQSPNTILKPDMNWVEPAAIAEFDEIASSLQEINTSLLSFGGCSWYSAVVRWLQEQVGRLGYEIHRLEQWNGRVGGVLLRVITNGPDFWFKAVSAFNAREMSIAQLLAAKHPARFPRIIVTHPEWNAFLLQHIEGVELYDCEDLDIWKDTARLLADTQLDWIGSSDVLLKAGAADLRACSMMERIPAFLDHVDDAMARQPKTPPKRLTRTDLDELGDAIYALCAKVDALPIEHGLANADFSPHNTLITERGPIFIDWAEACVSLPLIAGEYLWNRMCVETPGRIDWQHALRNAYLARWEKQYGGAIVECAAEVLPAFSIFAVAMFYHERECHGPSPYDSYLRSLARKLDTSIKKTTRQNFAIQA